MNQASEERVGMRRAVYFIQVVFQGAMMNIVSKEKLQILPQTMEKIIAGANQDVRQVIELN